MVGQLDYFIGKCFDKDADGRLTASERRQAEKAVAGAQKWSDPETGARQALDNGFLDKYVRGLDSTGQAQLNATSAPWNFSGLAGAQVRTGGAPGRFGAPARKLHDMSA